VLSGRLSPGRRYWLIVAVAVLVVLAVAVAQLANSAVTRQDRLIEQNLMLLQAAIDNHTTDHKQLPASVKDLNLRANVYGGVRTMLAQADVQYRPQIRPAESSADGATYYYQLCANFRRAKAGAGGYDYSPYLYPLGHVAGRQCYTLRISVL
jgi:hypothetical protein